MWTFAAAMLLGSVVLGWHYAVDGYAGIVMSVLVWKTVGFGLPRLRNQIQTAWSRYSYSKNPSASTASATTMPTTMRLPKNR